MPPGAAEPPCGVLVSAQSSTDPPTGAGMTLKSDLYNTLKDSGHPLSTTYASYTVEELLVDLKAAGFDVDKFQIPDEPEVEAPDLLLPDDGPPTEPLPLVSPEPPPITSPAPTIPVRAQDPEEMPGQRLNTQPEDIP